MSILKAYGRVAEYRNDSARIEVILYRQQGENVTDPKEIERQFPPNGHVFAPRFVERFKHPLDALIEFQISGRTSTKEEWDLHLMDIEKECKRAGYLLIKVVKNIFVHDQSILQPILKEFMQEECSHFYIQHKEFAYGPFKTQNQEIVPRSNTWVNKFRLTEQTYVCEDKHYILQEPREIIGQIDCMTQPQLASFFKDQIRKLNLGLDVSELKRLLELQSFNDLDTARIQRVAFSLDKLDIGAQTLKELLNHSTRFQAVYKEALQNIKDELRQEQLEPLLEQKTLLSKEIFKLSSKIDQAKQEQLQCQQALDFAKTDLEWITKERTRLIEDIKLHAIVKGTCGEERALLTYEEVVYQLSGASFSNLSEFVRSLQESIETSENGNGRLAQHIVYQLKDYSCFLTQQMEPILQLARLSNNCKISIQQVEPDWLKFERLYENGLQQIWSSAHEHKSMLHFFILEDINMASIECYGRPLIDLLSGVREQLPGQKTPWPENLWIFGVPISPALGDNFGLPLLKTTFTHWGYMPTVKPLTVNRKISNKKVLPLAELFTHDAIVPSFVNDYFPDS